MALTLASGASHSFLTHLTQAVWQEVIFFRHRSNSCSVSPLDRSDGGGEKATVFSLQSSVWRRMLSDRVLPWNLQVLSMLNFDTVVGSVAKDCTGISIHSKSPGQSS